MTNPTFTVSLTSAMAKEVADRNTGAYVVYFDPTTAQTAPVWTQLQGSVNGATHVGITASPAAFAEGKFYFVFQDTDGGTIPSVTTEITQQSQIGYSGNPHTNPITLNYRFDSLEASLQNALGDVGNLTEIQGFGIPLQLKIIYTSGTVTSSSTRGFNATGTELWSALGTAGAMVHNFAGSATSGGGQHQFAAGPGWVVNTDGTANSQYGVYQSQDWNYYISALINGGAMTDGNSNQIHIAGYFNHSIDANHIYHNPGVYSYRLTYNQTTSDITLAPDSYSQIKGAVTIPFADLANSIYSQ